MITSVADMQALAEYVNAYNDCEGKTFKLANDIDFEDEENYTPIGNFETAFRGVFDGNGKTIRNLNITSALNKVGLFGYIDSSGGRIQNLNVSNAKISGNDEVGVIAGANNSGTVINCTVSDSQITGSGRNIGGVVGNNNNGTVSNVLAENCIVSTTSNATDTGALVGYGTATGYYVNCNVSNSEGAVSSSAGTEIYSLQLPDGVTATFEDDYKVTIGGKDYFVKGTTVTLEGFTEGKAIDFGEGVTLEKIGNDVIVKTGDETAFTITGLTTKDYTPDNTGYTYSDGTYTYALAGTDSSITIDNHTLTHTAGNNGGNIFSIVGVNANVNLDNPSVDDNGKYTITLPASSDLTDGKTVTINNLNDAVNGATIKFDDGGSGCNVTAKFVATVETGAISNITVNEKLYTSLGSVLEIKTTADGDSSLFAGTIIVTDEQEGVKVISGNGVNVTVTSGAVTSITNLNAGNKVEYNGKTYTVIQYGLYIFDGTTYYRRLNADLLKLEESAITNIAVTNGVINFPENIAEDTVFVGENDKLVATYYSDTLYITGSGNYTVKTSSDVKISAGGNRIYKPISGGEIEISATSSSSSLSKGTVQLSSGSVNVGGQTIEFIELIGGDGITVTAAVTADNGTVTSFGGLNSGDMFNAGDYIYTVKDNGILKEGLPYFGADGNKYIHSAATNFTLADENWTQAEIVYDYQGIKFLDLTGENISYIDENYNVIASYSEQNGLTAAADYTVPDNLYVDILPEGTFTIAKEFKNFMLFLSSDGLPYEITTKSDADNYSVTLQIQYDEDPDPIYAYILDTSNISAVTLTENGQTYTYNFEDGVATFTESGNTYKQAITGNQIDFYQLMPSAMMTPLNIESNWELYNGTVTVTNVAPLKIYGGKTLTITEDDIYYPVTATVENGVLKSVSRSSQSGSTEFTYKGNTLYVSGTFTANFDDNCNLTAISSESGAVFSYNNKGLSADGAFKANFDDNGGWSVTTSNNITCNGYKLIIRGGEVTANYDSSGMLQTVSGIGAGEKVQNLKNGSGVVLEVTAGEISATYSTDRGGTWNIFGDLNSGDKFVTLGTEYTVLANGMLGESRGQYYYCQVDNGTAKTENEQIAFLVSNIQGTEFLDINNVNAVYVEDDTAKIVAEMNNNTLTAKDDSAANLYVNVSGLLYSAGTYTIEDTFKYIMGSYGDINLEVTATDDYTFTNDGGKLYLNTANITSLTSQNVTFNNSEDFTYTFGEGVATKTSTSSGENIYKQAITDNRIDFNQLMPSAIMTEYDNIENNWGLYNGEVTVTNVAPLKIYGEGEVTISGGKDAEGKDIPAEVTATVANGKLTNITGINAGETVTYNGKTLSVSSGEISATYENGELKSVSGLSAGASVTYDGKTYSHTITLPSGVTADGDKLTIDGKTYYADGSTVAISNFGEGKEITFDSAITSVEVSGNNIIAKVGDNTALTLSGLSLYSADENVWSVNGTSASYGTDIHKGAKVDGAKIIYQADDFDATFTLNNLANNLTADDLSAAVEVANTEITFTSDTVLDSSKEVTAPTGYTLKLGGDIVPSEEKTENGTMEGENFSYISAGNTAGYRVVDTQIKYFTDERKTFTISGLDTNAELGKNISVSGDKITISAGALAQSDATLTSTADYTMELDGVSAATLTDENWSGLNYQSEYYSVEGWEVVGNNINYTGTTTPKNLFALSGVASTGGFTVSKNNTAYTVKVADSAVANLTEETTVTLANVDSNITANFEFDSGFTGEKTLTQKAAATLSGGKYTSKTYKAYSEIDGANLTFHPATTAKEFTITNLSNAAALGTNVIVTDGETTNFKFYATALYKKSVEIVGDTFSVELDTGVDTTADTISESKILNNGTLIYTAAGVGEHYTKTSSGVNYTGQSHGETFTLTGIKSADGVSVSGGTVTLTESAFDLNSDSAFQVALSQNNSNISDAVNFELQFSGVNTSAETVPPALTKSGTNYIYRSSYTAAYFNGNGNTYNFVPAASYNEITISGLKTSNDLTVSEDLNATADVIVANGKVIVNSTALDDSHDKISIGTSNYSLELGGGISQVETIDFNQNSSGGIYTVTLSGTSSGYKKNGNEYTWQEQIGGEIFTVSGLKSGLTLTENNFVRSNGKITLKLTDEMLPDNPTEISISSTDATNYALDYSALSTNSEVKAHWEGFNYVADKTASSWTASNNNQKVTYTAATGGEILITVSGLSSNATLQDISLNDTIVTISANALDSSKPVEISDGYTLKLADDVVTPSPTSEHWEINSSTANYIGVGSTAGYVVSNNQIVYQNETTGDNLITISGLNSNATLQDISLNDTTVTISANALDSSKPVEISDGYTLKLADDVVTPSPTSEHWEINSSTANYIGVGSTAGYVVSNNQIVYQNETTGDNLITISGLNSNAALQDISLNDTTVTISANALDSSKPVEISDGYNLQLADDVVTPSPTSEHWEVNSSTANYIGVGSTAGYVVSNNQIVYQNETTGDNLITISGLNSNATLQDISLNDTTVTISANALDSSKPVEISDGYTLKLADDVVTPSPTSEHWEINSSTANYIGVGSTAGYVVSNNQIVYQNETTGEILITISGLSSNATLQDISLNDTTVTISANALDSSKPVEISDGYNLQLADDVVTPSPITELWEVSDGTATYKQGGGHSAGYILTENKIVYFEEAESTNLVTVKGLKKSATAKDILLDGTNVSVAAAAVNKGEITISDGFSLTLGTGTYKNVSVIGGENSDTFTQKGNQAVINAGADDDFISLENGTSKNTIIGGAGNDSIFATNGKNYYSYAEGDGEDVISGFTENDTLKITSGEIENWYVEDDDLIFKIGDGSIKILDGADLSITIIDSNNVTKIYSAEAFYDSKKKSVTLNSNIQGIYAEKISSVISINGAAADSAEIIGNAKNNSILGGSGNDTFNGGAGNDTLTGGNGSDVFIYNAGKDIVTDYYEEDKILIDSEFTPSVSGNDVIFKVGSNKLTVKNSGGKKISVNDSVQIYEVGKIYSEDKTELTLTSAFKDTVETGVLAVDASEVKNSSKITGNDSDNLIVGGKKADTLNGGAGADSLTGGDGKDIFVFESGEDVILDYSESDKISLKSEITNSYVNENDVILETKNGSVKILNGAGKKITTLDGKNNETVQIYHDGYTLNKKQTAVTLTSYFSESTYTAANTLVTIDGSAVDSVEIVGNAKNNSILGGSGDDILWGNAGNDTLFGGNGSDVFIYNTGKDIITDYDEEDKILIDSEFTPSVSGNDVVFKVGSNKLTVKDAGGKKISVNDSVQIYEVGKIYSEDKTELTLTSAFKDTVEDGVKNIYGSNHSSKITGNDSDNLIVGGKKADTLNGGSGSDTLTGENGRDLFVYENGDVVITDYTAGQDKIKISDDTISNYYFDGADVIFNTSKGSVTVQNAKDKKITLLNSNDKTSYWFDGNPNFIKAENQISSLMNVTDTNYSVSDIFADNVTEISKDDQPNITFEK